MLSVAIKNSVIFLLLVLLIHKLISHVLADRVRDSLGRHEVAQVAELNRSNSMHSLDSSHHQKVHDDASETPYPCRPTPEPSKPATTLSAAGDIPNDLLEYVFGSAGEAPPRSPPNLQPQQHAKLAKPDAVVAAAGGPHLVISEYPNEKCMNGGEVCPGIFAFDGVGEHFSSCAMAV